jgi:hypothetical protein
LVTRTNLSVPSSSRCQVPVRGAARIRSTESVGSFMISCAHTSTRGEIAPALVDLIDVDVIVDVHELEQMEQEQRDVGIGAGGHVRHRRRTRNYAG